MRKKLALFLGSSCVLLASQYAVAICAGNIEMHGNKVINVAMTSLADVSEAANKNYTDTYLLDDHNRRDGTLLSASKDPAATWVEAQDYCANLESAAIQPDGSLSDKVYSDWYLPTRVEYLAACLAHGSSLDYAQKTWVAEGDCKENTGYFWLKTYHLGPVAGPVGASLTRKKNWMLQAGKGELFNPATGDTKRDHGDASYPVRCIR